MEEARTSARQAGANWGRWGEDDQLGMLNLITPEAVVRAARLVRTGRVYSLSIPLGAATPVHPIRSAPQQYVRFHPDAMNGIGFGEDILVVNTHTGTHIDALSHLWVDGKMFNGQSAARVDTVGAHTLSVDRIGAIWTRGVLLDVAAARSVEMLEPGDVIVPADLEACCAAHGLDVRAGDAVLVRTGWYQMHRRDPQRYDVGKPGLGRAAIEWLTERDVSVLGVDTTAPEPTPPDPADGPDGGGIAHIIFLRNHGGYLIEAMDLEDLAADRAYEFLFVAAPLRIQNGLGSPVTPLAIT